jgi:hypothetical protein
MPLRWCVTIGGTALASECGRACLRLYNASGLDAVELRLSNEVRHIGTDDPQGLAQALQAADERES